MEAKSGLIRGGGGGLGLGSGGSGQRGGPHAEFSERPFRYYSTHVLSHCNRVLVSENMERSTLLNHLDRRLRRALIKGG